MKHILYTEDEGGAFKYLSYGSDEQGKAFYDKVVKSGRLIYQSGDRIVNIKPAYILIVEDVDGYDFVLGKRRFNGKVIEEEKKA